MVARRSACGSNATLRVALDARSSAERFERVGQASQVVLRLRRAHAAGDAVAISSATLDDKFGSTHKPARYGRIFWGNKQPPTRTGTAVDLSRSRSVANRSSLRA
jgi:hypothetical protein